MSASLYDSKAPRRAANLSVNSDLLRRARGLGVNLSGALEEKLEEILRIEEAKRWRERNVGAVEDYAGFVARHGVFSEGRRKF